MPTITREYLESLKRADLQKLCKDYGVKANLKTEALIDLVLDAQKQPSTSGGGSGSTPVPASEPIPHVKAESKPASRAAPSGRSSRAGSRARDRSGATMIVHDSQPESVKLEPEARPSSIQQDEPVTAPVSRTRKAKDTQFRLGVGRPVIAGGAGARDVTKVASGAKGKRSQSRSAAHPTEPTIEEEEPPLEYSPPSPDGPEKADHRFADLGHDNTHSSPEPTLVAESSRDGYMRSLEALKVEFTQKLGDMKNDLDALEPLRDEVISLRASVQKISEQLTLQTAKSASLEIEIRYIKANATGSSAVPTATSSSEPTATPRVPLNTGGRVSVLAVAGPDAASSSRKPHPAFLSKTPAPAAPGPSAVALGKRPRDAANEDLAGTFEVSERDELTQDELAKKVARPDRKRAKFSRSREGTATTSGLPHEAPGEARSRDISDLADTSVDIAQRPARTPAFTVFTGPDEPADDGPQPPAPPRAQGAQVPMVRVTSTAHQTENQNPFAFTFTTPGIDQYPYLDPPGSPTPAPAVLPAHLIPSGSGYGHSVQRAGGRRERNDLFHPFGTPPPPEGAELDTGGPVARPSGYLGSATELRPCTPPARAGPSSNEIGAGLGMTALPPDTPAPPMKRTMYGTELEGDTRFGDFGVEGVATGFWAGGRF